jgi:hypothetical protein
MTDTTKQAVNRFLGWKLPNDFRPDAGIEFSPSLLQLNSVHGWPTGTNLFTADQARAMFEYCLQDTRADLVKPIKTAPVAWSVEDQFNFHFNDDLLRRLWNGSSNGHDEEGLKFQRQSFAKHFFSFGYNKKEALQEMEAAHPAPVLTADSAAQHNNAERKKQDELILEALNAAQDEYSDAAKAYLIKTATEILEARVK